MARRRRYLPAQLSQHIVHRGNNRCDIFRDACDREVFLICLRDASAKHAVAVHNYVLMTNHFHVIATPSTSEGLPKMMHSMGGNYVRYFNRRHSRTGGLYEGRYGSFVIETERYLLKCMRYVELNPVRAKMVAHPRDYEWSSYHANALGAEDDLVQVHPFLLEGQPDPIVQRAQYQALCEEELSDRDLAAVQKAARDGIALGSPQFVKDIRDRARQAKCCRSG